MGNMYCAYIAKERRVDWEHFESLSIKKGAEITETELVLWKGDMGNAAALFAGEWEGKELRLEVSQPVDEAGTPVLGLMVEASFQKYVKTYTGCNWIPDPRPFYPPEAPKGNRAYSADVIWGTKIKREQMLERDGNVVQPFWMTVHTASDVSPGHYQAKVAVLEEGTVISELTLRILVLDLTLEDSEDYYLNLWQYPHASAAYYQVEPFSEEHLAILKNQMRPYMEAGGKVGTASIVEEPWYHQTYWDYPSMITWEKKQGEWKFDYRDFDRWVSFLLQEMKVSYVECYSVIPWENTLFYWEDGEKKMQKAAPGTRAWEAAWRPFLTDFVKHLEEKGWFGCIILAMDERPLEEMEKALDLIESIHDQKRESLKIGGAVKSFREEIWDRLFTVTPHISGLREDNIPLALFQQVAKKRREQGKLTSIYSMIGDYPGMFSMSDPGEAAWIIWYAEACGADGFLKWAYDAWCENPLEDNVHPYFEAGDMFFVYPGEYQGKQTMPRVSPRFQLMEEAIRDVRKLRQLRKKDEHFEQEAVKLLGSLKNFYGRGVNNGVGTAGFCTVDEAGKAELAAEVRRMHQAVEALSFSSEGK